MDKELAESILDAINILMGKHDKNIKYDYTIEGVVVANNGNGTYDVKINGEISTIKARSGLSISVNDIVYIRVPQGNFSAKFIDLIRP